MRACARANLHENVLGRGAVTVEEAEGTLAAMYSSLRRKPEPRCRALVGPSMMLDSGLRRNDGQAIMLCRISLNTGSMRWRYAERYPPRPATWQIGSWRLDGPADQCFYLLNLGGDSLRKYPIAIFGYQHVVFDAYANALQSLGRLGGLGAEI